MGRALLELTERQHAALEHPAQELLIGGDDDAPAGRSHLLRVMGIFFCGSPPGGIKVVLVQRSEFEVADEHVYGGTGLINMLAPVRSGLTVSPKEVRFSNGSTLCWSGCQDENQLHSILSKDPDVILVDRVDRIPEHLYERLAAHVLGSGTACEHKRIVATSRSIKGSWVERRWNGSSFDGRARIELLSKHLDPDLQTEDVAQAAISFREYCALAMPGLRWVRAREELADAGEKLINGTLKDREGKRIDRLMARAPAQLGKTTWVALLVAYWLHLNPEKTAAGASYNAERANKLSYMVREFYVNAGGRIRRDSRAVGYWSTVEGGGFWATSPDIGGAGNPANLLVEDDLDKDLAHALQPAHRKKVRDIWYSNVWLQRWNAEYGRLIEINIGTAHDLEDSQSFILNSAGAGEDEASRNWYLLVLQAIADRVDFPIEAPEGTIVAEDWRSKGEPLAPELPKFTVGSIERFRSTMSRAGFAAMMQGTPLMASGGGILRKEWFNYRDDDPGLDNAAAYRRCCRAWDLGHTEGGGDWTAGVKTGVERATNHIVIRHAVRARKAAGGVKRMITAVALCDGPGVVLRLPGDPSAGKSWLADVVEYVKEVYGWLGILPPKIVGKAVKGDKATRAQRIVDRAEPPRPDLPVGEGNQGGVDIYGGDWTPHLPDLVTTFQQVIEAAEAGSRDGDQDAARRFQELRGIADLARAVFHDGEDTTMTRRLNVDPGPWTDNLLHEARMFDGLPGHVDDQIDALGDSIEECASGQSGGARPSIPGW